MTITVHFGYVCTQCFLSLDQGIKRMGIVIAYSDTMHFLLLFIDLTTNCTGINYQPKLRASGQDTLTVVPISNIYFRTSKLRSVGFVVLTWTSFYASSWGCLASVQVLIYDVLDGMHCFQVCNSLAYSQSWLGLKVGLALLLA